MRSELRVFRGEDGEELFGLPGAPLPDPETVVPVRFLAALDNVVLAHADRSRLMTDDRRRHVIVEAAVLVDGAVRALWVIKREGRGRATAVLTVKCFSPLSPSEEAEASDEAARLLRFAAADAERHGIRFVPVAGG